MKKIEKSTINLLREVEGVKYEAYKDSAGLPTIAVGHLIKPNESYLLHGKIDDNKVNELLENDLKIASDSVNHYVHAEITQNQFDALVSFAFNLGGGALLQSTLLKNINSGVTVEEHHFVDWDKIHKDGKLVEVDGLKKRRLKEFQLYTQK